MNYFIAELMGTFLLILLGNGVVANVVLKYTKGNNSGWLVITTGWALAVYVGVAVAAPYSGAHLNPAVSVSLAIAGLLEWGLVLPYILAQLLGAMAGAFIVWVMYKDHYTATEDSAGKLATFCTSPAIRNKPANFLSELIGTFVLLFAVLYFSHSQPEITLEPGETIQFGLGSLGAIPVAFVVWVIGLGLGGPTGYAINPARDFGPRLMHALLPIRDKHHSDWSYAWIPIAGPIAGGAVAAWLYLIFQQMV